jgi:hypothetical protein
MLYIMFGFSSTYGIELAINSPIIAIHAMIITGTVIFVVGSTVNYLGL